MKITLGFLLKKYPRVFEETEEKVRIPRFVDREGLEQQYRSAETVLSIAIAHMLVALYQGPYQDKFDQSLIELRDAAKQLAIIRAYRQHLPCNEKDIREEWGVQLKMEINRD